VTVLCDVVEVKTVLALELEGAVVLGYRVLANLHKITFPPQ
jgi:hypothetical protein